MILSIDESYCSVIITLFESFHHNNINFDFFNFVMTLSLDIGA